MKMLRAFKTELDLNNVQRTRCAQHAGAARWAYNWGLARKQAAYQAGEKVPSAIDLHRELNTLKKTELGWLYTVSKCAPQEALRNLDKAFDHFFRRVALKKTGQWPGPLGYPCYKSKKRGLGSFRLTGSLRVWERHIQLPRLGRLRLKEHGYLPVSGVTILSATVSEQAGRWYISLQVCMEAPDPLPAGDKPSVGVDLGLTTLATVSDGTQIPNPKALGRNLTRVRRLHRAVSRKVKGSASRHKAVRLLAQAHQRVAHIRQDALHQATTWLTKTKSAIALEDLNVSGMLKNRKLARAIADAGWGEFRRQVTYKGAWQGCSVVSVSRFYPSSKTCSHCGQVKDQLALSERVFGCDECGFECDRDLNAARNLEQWLTETTVSSTESHACGENVRPDFPAVLDEAGTEHFLSLSQKGKFRRTAVVLFQHNTAGG